MINRFVRYISFSYIENIYLHTVISTSCSLCKYSTRGADTNPAPSTKTCFLELEPSLPISDLCLERLL